MYTNDACIKLHIIKHVREGNISVSYNQSIVCLNFIITFQIRLYETPKFVYTLRTAQFALIYYNNYLLLKLVLSDMDQKKCVI